jgi:hypothetical protein
MSKGVVLEGYISIIQINKYIGSECIVRWLLGTTGK